MHGVTSIAAWRDATVATVALVAAIYVGSGRSQHLDPALLGYLGATLVAAFGVVYRLSAFWRRPASAMYVRAALMGLRDRRHRVRTVQHAAGDLLAQRFVARRSRWRWVAHLALSLGTLVSFAITLPLVWGWLRFDAVGQDTYVPLFVGVPLARFTLDGPVAWLVFHGLVVAGVAVTLGAGFFLAVRLRSRHLPDVASGFHVGPLLLLLAVALTGLALPIARDNPGWFDVAAVIHEATVVLLLIGLPFSKLAHVLIRPLQIGVRAMRAPDAPVACCGRCGEVFAPRAQVAGVERLLAARGHHVSDRVALCPPCRRRTVAAAQAILLGAAFHPRIAGAHPATAVPHRDKAA